MLTNGVSGKNAGLFFLCEAHASDRMCQKVFFQLHGIKQFPYIRWICSVFARLFLIV